MTTDPTTIANQFNTFFACIGVELSANVNNTHNAHFTDYLLNPSMYNFTFELITEETTMEILNNLKPKPSCGYDGISTKILKTCKLEICKSLTLIINQSLSTGIFPDSLKVAKVIPLCKKGAFVDNFNFLGIIINKHLKWTSHVDMLTAKLSKTIGILNTLKHILPINIMRTIYNSLILCHLNYGVLLWGPKLHLNDRLHILQKNLFEL